MNIAGGDVPYFPDTGDLLDVSQRFDYGMTLASTFSTITPSGKAASSPPAPDASYTDGSALRRVDTRRNLHFLDAIIDTTVTPAEQEQAVKRMALFTDKEKGIFLRDYVTRIAKSGMYPYRLIEGLAPWGYDLQWQLEFVDLVLKKQGSGWVNINYKWVQPMIELSPRSQRLKIRGAKWKKVFLDICDDDDIGRAADDLRLDDSEREEWVSEEKSWW